MTAAQLIAQVVNIVGKHFAISPRIVLSCRSHQASAARAVIHAALSDIGYNGVQIAKATGFTHQRVYKNLERVETDKKLRNKYREIKPRINELKTI